MAGLLNSLPPSSPQMAQQPATQSGQPQLKAVPSGAFKDPILKKIEAQLISKLSPSIHGEYQSAVNAGMSALYGQQMGPKIMARLQSSTNVPADITRLIANVMATIVNEVIGQMPPAKRKQYEGTFIPSLLAASTTLACHVMDTCESMGNFKVTAQLAGQIIESVSSACLQKIGISQQQVQQTILNHQSSQGAQ